MTPLKFTVGFFAYNHEKYLEQSIRSVLDQTVPPDRIIFSSDGSTDRTLEIARDLFAKDPRVEYLSDIEVNKGMMHRMREGHARLRADEYLVGASGDDAWDLRRIEVHRRDILRTGAEWSIGTTVICDSDLRDTGARWDPVEARNKHSGSIFDIFLSFWPTMVMNGWAYKGSLFRRAGGFNPKYALEDFQLALAFARNTEPVLASDVVTYYRLHDSSLSRNRAFEMHRDLGRISLDHATYRPQLALKAASRRFRVAANEARRAGNGLTALRYWSYAYACWPTPIQFARVFGSAARSLLQR